MAAVPVEKQLTFASHGHILTNVGVWSSDSQWIIYDLRSDAAGEKFDGCRIERVHVERFRVERLFESTHGACCGVATANPVGDEVVFIHGPDRPTPDWQYAAHHRRGAVIHSDQPRQAETVDARDLTPPFTPGALRGGTHVHTYSGDGQWIAFTYEDHVLATAERTSSDPSGSGNDTTALPIELNQRNVGVSVPAGPVVVPRTHPRNHDGSHFSVLVTETTDAPEPGSDEISRAFSDAWIGQQGYQREDGTWQKRAIAFQGHVVTPAGETISEVFVVDIPDDVTQPGPAGPLAGTETQRPRPPLGTVQRRLTFTANRAHPGLQGPRHWLRSSPDGSQIAFLMKDDAGIVQLWTISPNGGEPRQVTHSDHDIASAFTWSPDGTFIAHVMDGCVCRSQVTTGKTTRLTQPGNDSHVPRPEACVVSPDGEWIAFVRRLKDERGEFNQLFVVATR
jgi:hypothetical protein